MKAPGNQQLARERVRREGRFEALKQRQRRTPAGQSVTTITTPGIDITIVASEHFAGDDKRRERKLDMSVMLDGETPQSGIGEDTDYETRPCSNLVR